MNTFFRLVCFVSLFSINVHSKAQCTFQVSANAPSTLFFGDTIYGGNHHVCFNSYLSYYGNNYDTLYLENAVNLRILWSDHLVVYADSGCVINYTGTGNNILLEVHYDSSVTMVDTVALNVITKNFCSGTSYDYSLMPTMPDSWCTLQGGTSNTGELFKKDIEIVCYPNPFAEWISIAVSDDIKMNLFDLSGRKISSHLLLSGKNTLDTEDLPSGLYFCQFDNGKTIKLIKQ